MATAADVVAAIDHILRYKPDWRGTLNDTDFTALNDMYQRAKNNPEEWLIDRDLPTQLDDKYLGALRLDNPTLFDGASPVNPRGQAPAMQPAGADSPPAATGHSMPGHTSAPSNDGFSGRAAGASQRVDDALGKNKTALAEADDELVDAVLGAKTGSEEGKAQLEVLQGSLIDQIDKLGPSLDTPAGQQQLTDFLQRKVQEILGIVKSSGMDAESKADVLDALSQRYDAVKDSGTGAAASSDTSAPVVGRPVSGTADSAPSASDVGSVAGGGGNPALSTDPLLDGLASDPLVGGLGALAGPAMGALSGLPGAMGSIIPGGAGGFGGGLPLGDLGGLIGGDVRNATAHTTTDDPTTGLKEDAVSKPEASDSPSITSDAHFHDDQSTKGDKTDPDNEVTAAQPGSGDQAQPVAADSGQVGRPAQAGPDVSVKLPDGSTVVADSPQLAHVGRLYLAGASLDDAAGQAQVTLLPAGAPVTEPVSPSQLRFGDYAQFTDHRVMALGGGKVWSGGQITAVDEMPTGPNFLGWARPQVQTAPAATIPAGAH